MRNHRNWNIIGHGFLVLYGGAKLFFPHGVKLCLPTRFKIALGHDVVQRLERTLLQEDV
jgi:hypothetical protein